MFSQISSPWRFIGLILFPCLVIAASADAQNRPEMRPNREPPNTLLDPPSVSANNNGSSYTNGESPIAEIREIPAASARAAIARTEYRQARSNLYQTVNRLHEDANDSPELIEALNAERAAYADFDAARNRVITRLWNDPKYAASMSLAQTLQEKIRDLHEQPKPPHSEIVATATVKMRYSASGRSVEAAALADDALVTAARQRLIEAGSRVAEIRARLARDIRRDPNFTAAARSYDDARVANIAADNYLNAAVDARDVAMNYAYYRMRNLYNYSYGYGYGYSGGYGSGY